MPYPHACFKKHGFLCLSLGQKKSWAKLDRDPLASCQRFVSSTVNTAVILTQKSTSIYNVQKTLFCTCFAHENMKDHLQKQDCSKIPDIISNAKSGARTIENSHSFFNVSYTWYKSWLLSMLGGLTFFLAAWARQNRGMRQNEIPSWKTTVRKKQLQFVGPPQSKYPVLQQETLMQYIHI